MSHAVMCDQCNATLRLDRADGDDEYGQRSSAWIQVQVSGEVFEFCTLACTREFLDRPELAVAIEEQLAAVAEVANTIRREAGSERNEE